MVLFRAVDNCCSALKYLGVVTILLIGRKMNCLNACLLFNTMDTAVVNAYISAEQQTFVVQN